MVIIIFPVSQGCCESCMRIYLKLNKASQIKWLLVSYFLPLYYFYYFNVQMLPTFFWSSCLCFYLLFFKSMKRRCVSCPALYSADWEGLLHTGSSGLEAAVLCLLVIRQENLSRPVLCYLQGSLSLIQNMYALAFLVALSKLPNLSVSSSVIWK